MWWQNIQKNKQSLLVTSIVFLLLGGSVGWILRAHNTPKGQALLIPLRKESSEYPLIGQLLASGENSIFRALPDLTDELAKYINGSKKQGDAGEVSVYWRDLRTSRWMGVNEEKKYAPASMLKVALLISYLRVTEAQPQFLDRTVFYNGLPKTPQEREIEGESVLMPGRSYTIAELLQHMIIESDNDAKDLLQQQLSSADRSTVFGDLGLVVPPLNESGDLFSPREYGIFFRVLYNATYLRPELSEAALNLLTKTLFKNGLQQGVPITIPVAHKFGRRLVTTEQNPMNRLQLHDCGIVYYPEHPYFLCVMTKGKEDIALQKIIADISRMVYEGVKKENN